MTTVYDALADIQAKIAVPKGRNNDFGGYRYRKAEDIISAARAAAPAGSIIRTSDRIEEIGGQVFVIATASITFAGETISADAGALHPLQKKGMDASQITGSASSYARKYALQGLFALDDGEHDPDSKDNRQENGNPPFNAAAAADRIKSTFAKQPTAADLDDAWKNSSDARREVHEANPALTDEIVATFKARKAQLTPEQKDAA